MFPQLGNFWRTFFIIIIFKFLIPHETLILISSFKLWFTSVLNIVIGHSLTSQGEEEEEEVALFNALHMWSNWLENLDIKSRQQILVLLNRNQNFFLQKEHVSPLIGNYNQNRITLKGNDVPSAVLPFSKHIFWYF